MIKNKRHGPLPDHPSRQDMVSAAILMERSGFSWSEWSVMLQLCSSELQIRQYILAYIKDCLNMWEGLTPSRGRFCYEIAAIAASNAWVKARKEMRDYPREYVQKLMESPDPWTEEQAEAKWKTYMANHPYRCRVSAKLLENLEREAATVYHEPYATPSGCTIIPFSPAGKAVP